MGVFVRQRVEYCQYQVRSADHSPTGLEINVICDDLLHVNSPTLCTGFAGTHTGWIDMRVVIRDGPPDGISPEWNAISETTLWCPGGVLSVSSIMGSTTEELVHLPVRPGLIRIRAHARDRIHETVRTDDDPPEEHELLVWPVTEDIGLRTLRTDDTGREWPQRRAKAAEVAMLDLIRSDDSPPAHDPDLPRVTVVRRGAGPSSRADTMRRLEGRLPVGDLDVHLTRTAEDTLEWRWTSTTAPLPDARPSTVRLEAADGAVTVRHEGVLGRHAVMLGLIWDHLLENDPAHRPAWEPALRARASEQAEQAQRIEQLGRLRAEREAGSWGGTPPTKRIRVLSGSVQAFARLDRPLLDRLAELPAEQQRRIAAWAARRAMRVAGVEHVGWIAEALQAVEAGGPLPEAITVDYGQAASRRLLGDPAIPDTVVTVPGGASTVRQQAAAFSALRALVSDSPLIAAIDAVYHAAVAFGDGGYASFLAEVPVHDA